MPRFFVDLPLAPDTLLEMPEGASRHAAGALRLGVGDAVTLFNGTGGEFHGTLVEVSPRHTTVRLERFIAREAELPFDVTIAQGLPAGEKMDWTVEKSVEMGVRALQPLALERSVVRLSGERATRRRAHWQGIARAAAEQCGRNRVPEIHPVAALQAWLAAIPGAALRLCAVPDATIPLARLTAPSKGCPVYLVVGPEGGLSEAEAHLLQENGFLAVSLGPRVLRTETAALAALATLAAIWSPQAP